MLCTCDEIYPWNYNRTVFLYQISPKSVHFFSPFCLITDKKPIQYIVNAAITVFYGSFASSILVSKK